MYKRFESRSDLHGAELVDHPFNVAIGASKYRQLLVKTNGKINKSHFWINIQILACFAADSQTTEETSRKLRCRIQTAFKSDIRVRNRAELKLQVSKLLFESKLRTRVKKEVRLENS